jgi:uroporphyrinogen decarboxylase
VVSPKQRVALSLEHKKADRVPADFLATPQIWEALAATLHTQQPPWEDAPPATLLIEPVREQILQELEIDLRVLSYDMFCRPPASEELEVDWWGGLGRSTPCRMWRGRRRNGLTEDVWGIVYRTDPRGAYDELAESPLSGAENLEEIRSYRWPKPEWWDFSPLPEALQELDRRQQYHIRYRIGSIFETAWHMRGMEQLLMDLALEPAVARYILERITEIHVHNTEKVLELAGERLDMLYFYDDVATQSSLLISEEMWREHIRPLHCRLIDLAKKTGKPVMYHCDGAVAPLIPQLVEMGVDLLNPIQPTASGMDPEVLKRDFGERLSFHGGIDIVELLPKGPLEAIRSEVRRQISALGKDGGYILASSHHIQPDTPVEHVLAMYDPTLRDLP